MGGLKLCLLTPGERRLTLGECGQPELKGFVFSVTPGFVPKLLLNVISPGVRGFVFYKIIVIKYINF